MLNSVCERDVTSMPDGLSTPKLAEQDTILGRLQLRGRDHLLYVAQFVPVRALAAFDEVELDASCLIVGQSDHMQDFKAELKAPGVDNSRIECFGVVGQEDLCPLCANARLPVSPTEAEGTTLSLPDAVWLDCTCLVSDGTTANAEMLEGYGSTFCVRDVVFKKRKLAGLSPNSPDTRSDARVTHDWEMMPAEQAATSHVCLVGGDAR